MEVREIPARETYDLRHSVLRLGFPRCSVHYDQDLLEGSFHLGVFENEKLISVGSFYRGISPGPSILPLISSYKPETSEYLKELPYLLRGMATDPEFRSIGAGSLLLKVALDFLYQRGATLLWFSARVKAFEFYHRLGFQEIGDVYNSYTVPHKVMYRRLRGL